MALQDNLDKKLDDVLERLNYLGMVIKNLKDRDVTPITEIGDIDEKLFREIANYEMSTEELKKDFVRLMIEDAEKLADACISNINICKKSAEEFDKFDNIIDFIRRHEDQDIEKSRDLQKFVMEAKDKLGDIRKNMNEKVDSEREEKTYYDKTQTIHRSIR